MSEPINPGDQCPCGSFRTVQWEIKNKEGGFIDRLKCLNWGTNFEIGGHGNIPNQGEIG